MKVITKKTSIKNVIKIEVSGGCGSNNHKPSCFH